jgi:hypothetical protein
VDDKDKETEDESFAKYWGWFGVLVVLANEDISKIEGTTKYPLTFVLNYLTYQKDLQEIKTRKLKTNEQRSRIL